MWKYKVVGQLNGGGIRLGSHSGLALVLLHVLPMLPLGNLRLKTDLKVKYVQKASKFNDIQEKKKHMFL